MTTIPPDATPDILTITSDQFFRWKERIARGITTPAPNPSSPLRWTGKRRMKAQAGVLVLGAHPVPGLDGGDTIWVWSVSACEIDRHDGRFIKDGDASTPDDAKTAAILAARKIATDILLALESP